MVNYFLNFRYFSTIVSMGGSVYWLVIYCARLSTASSYSFVLAAFWHRIKWFVVSSGCWQYGHLAFTFSCKIKFMKWLSPHNFIKILVYRRSAPSAARNSWRAPVHPNRPVQSWQKWRCFQVIEGASSVSAEWLLESFSWRANKFVSF